MENKVGRKPAAYAHSDLVTNLRRCVKGDCKNCDLYDYDWCTDTLLDAAADALEESSEFIMAHIAPGGKRTERMSKQGVTVEVCPVCGEILLDIMLASFPPIPAKLCLACGWRWQGEPEKITFVPFNEPTKSDEKNS